MLDPAPYFFLALSIFFHLGIVLPLLSGWLYNNTRVEAPPPPISVRMAAPRMAPPPPLPVAAPRPRRNQTATPAKHSAASSPSPPPARRQALTAPSSSRQVAAAPSTGQGNYPTYPQGRGGPGRQPGPPGLPEGPGIPQAEGSAAPEPVLETAHVTGLPRTIQVPTFLQKQEAPNFVITFEVTVEADGRSQVRLFQGSGCTGLDQMLTQELGQMHWEPATRDGQPFASTFKISVSGDFRKGCETFTLSQRGRPELN
ncbi:MAG: hypothetical protein KF760_25400 [Candidatus Eremiobacteraeota bacterium]|nr:hypothetical protein [Candidatus Eremiobacteraeota bacterium]MCW5866813.1 hypothetical protein [Candidatus Eremiobacteraeota bacterium]